MLVVGLFVFAGLVLGQNTGEVTVLSSYPQGERPSVAIPPCLEVAATPDCQERRRLSELDGYALEPWIRIRFSGPVRTGTLRDGIYIEYGAARHTNGFWTYPQGYRMPINQVAWDPATNTAYAKPDEALEHDRDYTLVIGDRLLDANGSPVRAPREPIRFHTINVVRSLLAADLGRAGTLRVHSSRIIDLSVFRSLRVQLDSGAALVDSPFPPDLPTVLGLGLRRVAFFEFVGPRGETIHGNVWLPASPAPAAGYPVVLVGHGLGDHRLAGPAFFASALIGQAAVISINAVGHGYGPRSRIVLERNDGGSLEIPLPGRGRDSDGGGVIDAFEGCVLFEPGAPAFIRDCLRDTALDYRKLLREIEAGVDFDGDGRRDLDSNRVQYLGQSLGAMYGAIFLGLEANVEGAVLNAGGGSALEAARYSPALRNLIGLYMSATHPEVRTGFLQVPDPLLPRFEDVLWLNDVRAGRYLEYIDRVLMLETDGAPASFAPFFKQATLYGNSIKRVLFQYALGDQTVPNPANSQLIRAGYEYELVSAYRHDWARAVVPSLPANPHTFLAAFVELSPETLAIGQAALQQAALFLASGRREVPDVNFLVTPIFGRNLFETPARLPETPGFVR
jgi:hypothetical protein